MKYSVVICSHNPRADYLTRVLEGLKNQSMPKEKWELLLVDNASTEPLAGAWDLSWHPQARHIREETLGLSHARLCAIHHFEGEMLVFIDDDNILASDYLDVAGQLAEQWPQIGVWSGNVNGEYEVPLEKYWEPFLELLAIRKVTRDRWGNTGEAAPFGAGMCVRRSVALTYRDQVRNNAARLGLGRRGDAVLGGEDQDIAATSLDFGLGTALFSGLSLIHLIPQRRLTEDYLIKIIRGSETSYVIENALRGRNVMPRPSRIDRYVAQYKYYRGTRLQRRIHRARQQAWGDALAYLAGHGVKLPE